MKQVKKQMNLLLKVLMVIPIMLIFFLGTNTSETIVSANNGDYKTWKQYEGDWADRLYVSGYGKYKFGDHVGMPNKSKGWGTMADWGCYLTAMAIQIGKSGVGPADNDPWKFAEHMHNGGYMLKDNDSLVQNEKDGVNTYTGGKFRAHSAFKVSLAGQSKENKTAAIKKALDAGFYPIVRVGLNGGTHFVAVDRIEGDKVVLMDPGSSKDDLFAKYGSTPNELRVFEADVPSTTANGNGSGGGGVTTPPAGDGAQQPNQPNAKEQEKINIARMEWDEGKIKGMPKPREWEEDPVEIIHISKLDQVQQYSISKWKDEVKQTEKIDVTKIIRTALMVLGILMIIFSLVYLIAYVIDRVSFLEFKFFEWLTAGKLTASATGDSTFFSKNEGYPKLVNIRDLIIIETLLIGLSILLLSGGIFYVISQLIEAFKYMQGFLTKL